MAEKNADQIHAEVSQYYGSTLQSTDDLKTSACSCSSTSVPPQHRQILRKIHPEIISKFYGCGSPIPELLEGTTVVDLGSGTGRDVYLCSALVGEHGKVIGVDMTDEQLATATRHIAFHTEAFGFKTPNVEFKKGHIENLRDLTGGAILDNTVDAVISNCVINLCPDKQPVFNEIYRILRNGGELYFSDVFADRRIPERLRSDATLWGECLSGALYIQDFRRMLECAGFPYFSVVVRSPITFKNAAVSREIGDIKFYSMTVRAVKLPAGRLEDQCEDYGQTATYRGTIPGAPDRFALDLDHVFPTGKPVAVCGNTGAALAETRFAPHFTVTPRGVHRGLFECHSSCGCQEGGCGACCGGAEACGCGGAEACGCASGGCGCGAAESGCGCASGGCGCASGCASGGCGCGAAESGCGCSSGGCGCGDACACAGGAQSGCGGCGCSSSDDAHAAACGSDGHVSVKL